MVILLGVGLLFVSIFLILVKILGITIESKKRDMQPESDFLELENEIEELKEEIRKQERMKDLEAERNRLEVELNGFNQDGEIDYKKAYEFAKHTIKYHTLYGESRGYLDSYDMAVMSKMRNILYKLEDYEQNT